jgi:hypothetical protein
MADWASSKATAAVLRSATIFPTIDSSRTSVLRARTES